MDTQSVENFTDKISSDIVRVLLKNNDSADFDSDPGRIEGEIYDIATCYAKILFFESESFLSENAREATKSFIRTRFHVTERQVNKMKDIDLVAHWIKSEAKNKLGEHGIVMF